MRIIMEKREKWLLVVALIVAFVWTQRKEISDFVIGVEHGYSAAISAHDVREAKSIN